MSLFGLAFDDRFKRHITGVGHPERSVRIDAIRAGLEVTGHLSAAARVGLTPIDMAIVHRLHLPAYTQRAQAACESGAAFVDDPDSAVCPESWTIARLAAGATVDAARRIARGELRRAFCAVRPPGHHAEADRSMGFCLLNNIALAASVLRREFDMDRIFILDWDVHHGNGTQHLFEADPTVLFVSLHGHPATLYPGTGYAEETGVGAGAGYTLNIPMPPGSDDAAYRREFDHHVRKRVAAFKPDIVLISAGFDAHDDDPLGNQSLSDEGFVWLTQATLELAQEFAGGRVLSVLEGGYHLDALRRCTAAHVELLADI
jgi:acetoin utilization deacetylase AcuC-like enzyme